MLMSRKVVYFQVPATWEMGESQLKAHLLADGSQSPCLPLSEGRGFIRRGRGPEQRDQGAG